LPDNALIQAPDTRYPFTKGHDMSEKIVAVVGSNQSAGEYESNYFWVIDFSNAWEEAPGTVQVPLPFSGSGCVVACSGTLAAVGNFTGPGETGSSVTIYDISTPSDPRPVGSAGLPFDGIGVLCRVHPGRRGWRDKGGSD